MHSFVATGLRQKSNVADNTINTTTNDTHNHKQRPGLSRGDSYLDHARSCLSVCRSAMCSTTLSGAKEMEFPLRANQEGLYFLQVADPGLRYIAFLF